jgi:hypothetical protein
MRSAYKTVVGEAEVKTLSEDKGVDGRIILQWIIEKYGGNLWIGFIWFRIGTSGGLL